MIHPWLANQAAMPLLASTRWDVTFHGRPAHAALAPHLGINALDAVRLAFAGIDALRQQVRPDVRIHGIVTHGGDAPNVIPERPASSSSPAPPTAPTCSTSWRRASSRCSRGRPS
jgi:metal-dependent amidase/aminoacylase/carboxypeptidase family protein